MLCVDGMKQDLEPGELNCLKYRGPSPYWLVLSLYCKWDVLFNYKAACLKCCYGLGKNEAWLNDSTVPVKTHA